LLSLLQYHDNCSFVKKRRALWITVYKYVEAISRFASVSEVSRPPSGRHFGKKHIARLKAGATG
jgi:hypothetical protein